MDDIQISLKANAENGILSIQGIDMFSLIDTEWNWSNIASIKCPLLKTFFTQAKELLFEENNGEEDDDESLTDSDFFADWTYEDWAKALGVEDGDWTAVVESEDLSDKIIIEYDDYSDLDGRIEVCLCTPHCKIVWDESVYLYIYSNLDWWLHKIEETIETYKELGNIRNDFDKIISTIRAANGPTEAAQNLIQAFGISEQTAKTICEMKIDRLISYSTERCAEIVQYREEQKKVFEKLITFKKRIEEVNTKTQNHDKQ